MFKSIFPWILFVALLLRLALIPISIHPDFRAVNLAGYLITQKGQLFSFYDYLSKQPRSDVWVQLYGDDLFIYPPIAYLTHAVFNGLLFWAYPSGAFFTLLNDIGSIRSDPGFIPLMYLLKLPYLLADAACLFLLAGILPQKNRKIGLLFWLFNPVTIYTSYLMGQFDIFIALFILLALRLAPEKSSLSAVALGIGAGFKPFILILAPFFPGNWWKNSILAVVTYGLTLIPYLGSAGFRQYALLAPQTDKLLYAKVMISGSQFLPLFVLGLILLFWWKFYRPGNLSVEGWIIAPLVLFYALTHYHPQWFVWAAPLLTVIFAMDKDSRLPIAILTGCYLFIIFTFEPSLNFGLFGINFSLFNYLNKYYPADQLVSIVRAIFAATGIFLLSRVRQVK